MAALQALLVGMSLAASHQNLQENMLRNLEEMRRDPQLFFLDNQIRSDFVYLKHPASLTPDYSERFELRSQCRCL